jgi:hypothetical protein
MEYVIVFVLGMVAATVLIRWMARRAIDQFVERFADVVEEKIEDNQMRVDVEFDQNIYFLYNSDNGSFVAQGNNLLDLRKNLEQRFPNRTINIVKGDPTVLTALKNQIKDINEDSNSVRSTS